MHFWLYAGRKLAYLALETPGGVLRSSPSQQDPLGARSTAHVKDECRTRSPHRRYMPSHKWLHANAFSAYMYHQDAHLRDWQLLMIKCAEDVCLAGCTAKKVDHLALEHPRFSPTNRLAASEDMHAGKPHYHM